MSTRVPSSMSCGGLPVGWLLLVCHLSSIATSAFAGPTPAENPPETRCFAAGNAKVVSPPSVVPRPGSIEARLMVGLWEHKSAGGPDIILCFDDAHRAGATLSYRGGASFDAFSDEWKWVFRDGRLDITLIDEDAKTVHANCRITLQTPPGFVLSACRQRPKAVDLSGMWTFEKEP